MKALPPKPFNRKWLPAALLLLSLLSASAQDRRGIVAGTVTDTSGAILPGALVQLEPSGRRAVVNDQGHFRIAEVAKGDYKVRCTYIGFSDFSKEVDVAGDGTTTLDPVLKVGTRANEVQVIGDRLRGEAEAINIQRTSKDIVQVLPSRVINSLPNTNTNIADAVGRLPSVTLDNTGNYQYRHYVRRPD